VTFPGTPTTDKCPLCDLTVKRYTLQRDNMAGYTCPACGSYAINGHARLAVMLPENKKRRYLLSAFARRYSDAGTPADVFTSTVDVVLADVTPLASPFVVLDDILAHIHRRTESLAGWIDARWTDYPLFALPSADEYGEFVVRLKDLGYVDYDERHHELRLSLNGWRRMTDLENTVPISNRAFVAMWFDESMNDAYAAIEAALIDTGWQPHRIDRVEHNGKIDDRIIADIRRSGLVIAEFTGQRGGVYFEAGYAMGSGIPVIWVVREQDIAEVHFDTRQYNHVTWSTPEELTAKLHTRVVASLPRPSADGPSETRRPGRPL
jgi:hypothetical protein